MDSPMAGSATALAALALALTSVSVSADVPASQQPEVAHLLEYIRTSPCRFIRNGRDYDGERAYRHVQLKYDYFRDEITSTEEFIELSAALSTRSGKPYSFACEGQPERESRGVLLGELAKFRAARSASSR